MQRCREGKEGKEGEEGEQEEEQQGEQEGEKEGEEGGEKGRKGRKGGGWSIPVSFFQARMGSPSPSHSSLLAAGFPLTCCC